jgi:spermidine/putrescine transport system permease protein
VSRRGELALQAPGWLVVGTLFAVPLVMLFVVSFWTVRSFRLQPAFSLAAYARVLGEYLGVLGITLGLAFAVALVCVLLGFAFALAVRFHAGRAADAMVLATMVTLFGGYLVKVYAWKSILGADGLINTALRVAGLVDAPVSWLIYSPTAVVIALVHFQLPFAILPIYAGLRGLRLETIEAARDLGASRTRILRSVVLPISAPGIAAAFAFSFLVSAGDYVTPTFLGGPSSTMLGQFIAIEFGTRFNWPGGAAMSFVLLATSLTVCAAVWFLLVPRRE